MIDNINYGERMSKGNLGERLADNRGNMHSNNRQYLGLGLKKKGS